MNSKEFAKSLRISLTTVKKILRFNLVKHHKENRKNIIDETVEEYLKRYEKKNQS